MLIGVSAVAATLAATAQFAGGLGGDAPASGESVVATAVATSTSTVPETTTTTSTTLAPTTTSSTSTVPSTTVAPTSTTTSTVPDDDALDEVVAMLSGLTIADPDPDRQPYDRETYQPDGWADLDGDCISGRHEVLITLSEVPVEMTSSGCSVESGSWTDPYTGAVITEATDITIDHVVPLSEAHRAGGWRWDAATKIAFANDETPGVLLAVGGDVNQAKADKTPDKWLPPLEESHCAYAADWVSTKARWQLSVTDSESAVLNKILAGCTGGQIAARASTAPPVIVIAPPPTTTTLAAVVPADDGASELRVAQCQKREERVVIENPTAIAISLAGYVLHDEEARHSVALDQFGSIEAGARLVVLTGEDAAESPGEVVWKRQNVWNNDGDTAFLVAPSGTVTSAQC